MPLKPQDLLVCLELVARDHSKWTYAQLAESLGLSASETKGAVDRATAAGLLASNLEAGQKPLPIRRALVDFVIHGARHAFFVQPGGLQLGVPTAWAAPPLKAEIMQSAEPPPVWPSPNGTVRGQAVEPLYRSVPHAVQGNPDLHELLALVDALRIGRIRERELAAKHLRARLLGDAHGKPPATDDAA